MATCCRLPTNAVVPAQPALPVAPAPIAPTRGRSRWKALGLLAIVIIGACGGGAYWWHTRQGGLPLGIVSGNGRIEADEIDIDTKFAGRIAEMLADEGDMVKAAAGPRPHGHAGHRSLAREVRGSGPEARSRASTRRAPTSCSRRPRSRSRKQEFDRTSTLVARGFATNELLDQRRQALNGATAALNAANDRVGEAARALDAATHDVELYKVNIADNTLVAPRDGRIQYRIANIGEVLPAGGKVFTMLDIEYVYMDIYLPTDEAGKVKIGADARIVLDAVPECRDPGEGRVRRHAGAVHAQDGGDQGRARQADVPGPGEDRSRAIARARGFGEKRPARRRLCQI